MAVKLLRSICVSLVVVFSSFACVAAEVPSIAAAANIKFAMDKIATQFTQDTGKKVRISYGSSGNFVAQIRHGAPFELFLSASLLQASSPFSPSTVYRITSTAIFISLRHPLRLDLLPSVLFPSSLLVFVLFNFPSFFSLFRTASTAITSFLPILLLSLFCFLFSSSLLFSSLKYAPFCTV